MKQKQTCSWCGRFWRSGGKCPDCQTYRTPRLTLNEDTGRAKHIKIVPNTQSRARPMAKAPTMLEALEAVAPFGALKAPQGVDEEAWEQAFGLVLKALGDT